MHDTIVSSEVTNMNHDILKEVILDQLEIIKKAEIIDRNYVFEKKLNYILVGLRRSGKSTLLYKIAKELPHPAVQMEKFFLTEE